MRWHRALLHLYPKSFRDEYGEEMAADVRQRLRDAGSAAARAWVVLSTALDAGRNAAAVHADILVQDLRYTARSLRRSGGFAATAIAIVGLGIGANTAAFSVTDFVLLRPLPFVEPDRLVTIWQRSPGYSRMELSAANIRDWAQGARSFERIGVHRSFSANLIGPSEPERIAGASVNPDFFPTLGVGAAIGRVFGPDDAAERAALTVVLSDRLWRAGFGADPGVIGRAIVLDDRAYVVIGVMPPMFSYPRRDVELWVPLVLRPDDFRDRNNNELYAIGRLAPGATLDSARAELAVLAAQSREQYPKENEHTGATANALREELSRDGRVAVLALSGAAACVLLIVCANLANLLLARALGRRPELAIRTALGAGRERLVRQLATESMVLAALGGALGIASAGLMVPLLWRLVPAALPTDAVPSIDLRVVAFAVALTVVTALAFGVIPLLRASSGGEGLREGARTVGGRRELRGALVVAEVAGSIVLLVATGLLVRALWTIQSRDPGFRSDGVLTLRTELPAGRYAPTAIRADFYEQVRERIRSLPGVTDAGFTSGLPMVWGGGIWPVGLTGIELERRADNTASLRFITPGFFESLAIPIVAGRNVSDSDTLETQPAAVVSESFVKRYWPGQDALGRRFHFARMERTIVGVVRDIRVRGLERESEPQVYLPHRQVADGWFWGYTPRHLVVRTTGAAESLVPLVRGIIREADPQLPIVDVRMMEEIVGLQTASRSVQARVLAAFALVAVFLAGMGIHGLLAFTVSERTREIGVRMALGATRADVLRLVAVPGLRLVAIGCVPGLALAYAAGRWLQTLLVGIEPGDAPTFAAAAALAAVMAIAGTLLPALRAVRVDPTSAMRAE